MKIKLNFTPKPYSEFKVGDDVTNTEPFYQKGKEFMGRFGSPLISKDQRYTVEEYRNHNGEPELRLAELGPHYYPSKLFTKYEGGK